MLKTEFVSSGRKLGRVSMSDNLRSEKHERRVLVEVFCSNSLKTRNCTVVGTKSGNWCVGRGASSSVHGVRTRWVPTNSTPGDTASKRRFKISVCGQAAYSASGQLSLPPPRHR